MRSGAKPIYESPLGFSFPITYIILATSNLSNAQQSTYTSVSDEEENSGLGMAEIIAIVICGLILLAFLLACYVIIRNAKKRKRMSAAKGAIEMSFDKIGEGNAAVHPSSQQFAVTRTVNRDRTAAPLPDESSQSAGDSASEDSSEYAD